MKNSILPSAPRIMKSPRSTSSNTLLLFPLFSLVHPRHHHHHHHPPLLSLFRTSGLSRLSPVKWYVERSSPRLLVFLLPTTTNFSLDPALRFPFPHPTRWRSHWQVGAGGGQEADGSNGIKVGMGMGIRDIECAFMSRVDERLNE